MKAISTLPLTATATQRWAPLAKAESPTEQPATATIPGRSAKKESSFNVLIRSVSKPLRISVPVITTHPVLWGKKSFLRALREAELEAWNANARFPAV